MPIWNIKKEIFQKQPFEAHIARYRVEYTHETDKGKDKSAPGYRHPHIAHHYPSGTMHGTFPQYHQLAVSTKGKYG